MVAPVVSSTAQTAATEQLGRVKAAHTAPPPSLHTSTISTLAHPTPASSHHASLERELRDIHDQRVAVMDGVCELLSDIPAAQINSMFGVSADHVQRKLAVRKQLLSREEDVKRKLSSHTSITHLSPSPLSPSPLPLSLLSSL
jgi:bloom syndrome protein